MDADGVAENGAAIVLAAFPHMKHAAPIAPRLQPRAAATRDKTELASGLMVFGSLKIAGHLARKTSIAVRASLTPRNLSAW
jgi:hypothetical protein